MTSQVQTTIIIWMYSLGWNYCTWSVSQCLSIFILKFSDTTKMMTMVVQLL